MMKGQASLHCVTYDEHVIRPTGMTKSEWTIWGHVPVCVTYLRAINFSGLLQASYTLILIFKPPVPLGCSQ
jgi:hypothetical protein